MSSNNHVVINRENMTFVASADTLQKATLIANNDCADFTCVVLPLETKRYFSTFGALELLLLYKNCTGQTGDLYNYAGMLQKCYDLALALPTDPRTVQQLENVAAQLPIIPPPPVIPKPPILVKYDSVGNGANPFVEAPKAPTPKNPSKPSAKGSTGRVWEVADRVYAEMGGGLITKEMRTKIIAECEAAGIHPATAATQFSKWKASK